MFKEKKFHFFPCHCLPVALELQHLIGNSRATVYLPPGFLWLDDHCPTANIKRYYTSIRTGCHNKRLIVNFFQKKKKQNKLSFWAGRNLHELVVKIKGYSWFFQKKISRINYHIWRLNWASQALHWQGWLVFLRPSSLWPYMSLMYFQVHTATHSFTNIKACKLAVVPWFESPNTPVLQGNGAHFF